MSTSHIEVRPGAWNTGEVGRRARRSPLDWLSRMGIGLLSFFSNSDDAASGESSYDEPIGALVDRPVEQPIPDCCILAKPEKECHYTGHKANYTCPPGFQKQYWPCCEGTRLVGCGECSSGPTCFDRPFDCSIWWWIEGSSC